MMVSLANTKPHQASPNRVNASLPGQSTLDAGLMASCWPNDWKSCGFWQSLVDAKLRSLRIGDATQEPEDTLNSGTSPPSPQTSVPPFAGSAAAAPLGPALRPAATPAKNASTTSTAASAIPSTSRSRPFLTGTTRVASRGG